MTVSSTDTAELPRVRTSRTPVVAPTVPMPAPAAPPPAAAAAPATVPAAGVVDLAPCPDRLAIRAERLALRRQRRLWSLFGLSVLAAALGGTVAMLGIVH
jgi:hypothetical protein